MLSPVMLPTISSMKMLSRSNLFCFCFATSIKSSAWHFTSEKKNPLAVQKDIYKKNKWTGYYFQKG
jgi:hypothetical protein